MSIAMVSDLVEFLSKHDLPRLERLRGKYRAKEEQQLLEEDGFLAASPRLLRLKVELAVSSLSSYLVLWTKRSEQLSRTLDRSNKWNAIGAILASVGSGASLSLVLGGAVDQPTTIAFSSGIALIGGLISLSYRFLRRDVYGNENAISETHKKLSSGAAEAATLIQILTPYTQADEVGDELEVVEGNVAAGNRLIMEMTKAMTTCPQ